MLEQLKKQVCQASVDLVKEGLVIQTSGNVSGVDRRRGLVVIKPSGVPYDNLKPEHPVVALKTGKIVEGGLRPSSDATALWRASCASLPHVNGPWLATNTAGCCFGLARRVRSSPTRSYCFVRSITGFIARHCRDFERMMYVRLLPTTRSL